MRYRGYQERGKDKVYVNRDNVKIDCWRTEKAYLRLRGDEVSLHKKWAYGEGEVARHLCGEKKCINPLHIVRGDEFENARDEIEVRDFMIELFENMTEDFSLRDIKIEQDMRFYVIVPRATIKLRQSHGFIYMKDTVEYGREMYRRSFVERLCQEIRKIPIPEDIKNRLDKSNELFNLLSQRIDVQIIPIMEGL
jgi:hypothetical protein